MDVAKHKKVAVGMSGGVDSSVAALLLKDRGYEVTGVFMQCWDVKDDGCAADEDKAYALQTAMALDIPFKTLDFRNEYKERVIDYFYTEYEAGRTPNPDVMCNKEIKFGIFYEWAMKEGFDFVATGHYSGIENRNGEFKLLKGVDGGKDQSYFLYRLGQEQLGHTIFPLGELHKPEVRKLAKDKMLPSYKRPESMGICFIGEVDIKDFLGKRIDEKKGKVITSTGEEIGDHDGVWFLTIGQRHGFRLKKYFGDPMYVIAKDAGTNTLTVGSYEEALRDKFAVSELSWVGANPFDNADEITCDVRIRHLGKLTPGVVKKSGEQTSDVSLSSKLFGVAPGQSAVFYKGDEVLGGGIIG
ncbi:MAG: tRNA-specific 2-thiouridylase MnmA [candidate division WWE3 bacterium GW2011_GWF2_41_45]|uniref:tRNA-specific 2-thiouridylase MnmA n=2 Tax=Katanobacteria TaxID=422282 RepID=A0A1F4W3W1_UNCKA|nr:MAG: tRNA-specific 2-thiouridylase MnmA [candidate division WWE3 bacterium GW2011_GWC2_41_23]KKS09961.1 MAG: tRNA-specific 2-thiouridylase MnmA [candidate division WWE3 bacterium GW2011_GWF2_41_45]KKS19805.1 MAG: tRNA-specific 2-thiouridylase MnmA [candidate division WWE3 bacterium GW2011_GWE1_41_72]KKS30249.1 MAG: tRNA-specific 2-thiouridylase MnmA [candidate division WWE3 bacterium GW2011_GWD2_42_11]KKS50849.1 MAG: tRNA-specific 2-thiouridylase MnmA [candidate division WWE3 bacterium GW201